MTNPNFTVRQLADFAWSKGSATYNYLDCNNCAVATFLRETGRMVDPSVGGDKATDLDLIRANPTRKPVSVCFPAGVNLALVDGKQSYLALAGRLECLIAEQSKVVEPAPQASQIDAS